MFPHFADLARERIESMSKGDDAFDGDDGECDSWWIRLRSSPSSSSLGALFCIAVVAILVKTMID